jgi:hypothetical protein
VVATKSLRAVVGTQHDLHQHERKGVLRSPRRGLVGERDVGGVVGVEFDTAGAIN